MRTSRQDRAAGGAATLAGRVREAIGKLTGQRSTGAKGKATRTRGRARTTRGRARRWAR